MNAHTRITVDAAAKILDTVVNGAKADKTAELLDNIRSMAGTLAKADRTNGRAAVDAGNAIKAAGGDTAENKRAFQLAYISSYLSIRDNAKVTAADILASAGHGRKLSKKQTRARTETEELAYGACRTAYHRALKAAGLIEPKERGARAEGNAKGEGEGEGEGEGDKVTVTNPGDAGHDEPWTRERLESYIRGQAVALRQTLNKRMAETGGCHAELAAAVMAFADRVDHADEALEAQYK